MRGPLAARRHTHRRRRTVRPAPVVRDYLRHCEFPQPPRWNRRRRRACIRLPRPAPAGRRCGHVSATSAAHRPDSRQVREDKRQRIAGASRDTPRTGQDRRQHFAHTQQHPAGSPERGPRRPRRQRHHARRTPGHTCCARPETQDTRYCARRVGHRKDSLHRTGRSGGGQQPSEGARSRRETRDNTHPYRLRQACQAPCTRAHRLLHVSCGHRPHQRQGRTGRHDQRHRA